MADIPTTSSKRFVARRGAGLAARALAVACLAVPVQGCALPLLVGGAAVGGHAAAPRDAEGRKCYPLFGCYETGESLAKAVRERDSTSPARRAGSRP